MNKIIKLTSTLLLSSMLVNTPIPAVLAEHKTPINQSSVENDKKIVISDSEGNITKPRIDKGMQDNAQRLENYFYVQDNGAVGLRGNAAELSQVLIISQEDANLLFEAVKELPNTYFKGPVGLRFNLGPTVRGMSGWAAGTFAAGYAGWHLKQFAANPVTAGLVAVISGAIGWSVKTAVESQKSTTLAVVYVPGVELVYTVNVP